MDTTLTAHCDQCDVPVTGIFMASLPSGGCLVWCLHHTNVNREALLAAGGLLYALREIPT